MTRPPAAARTTVMPKGSKVHKVFTALKRKGKSPASAAHIAQSSTGQSLKTGRKPKRKR